MFFCENLYHRGWRRILTTLPTAMHIHQNSLRLVRKRTKLTQIDMASILKTPDFANISRWEQGLKTPSLDILIGYHLLFDIPIESLFERQKNDLRKILIPRIEERIKYLKTLEHDFKIQGRIDCLVSILNRLAL